MEKIKTLLIANRGEIAVRIIKTARLLGIKTITIYSSADSASLHVSDADISVLLPGQPSTAYTDGDSIISIAKEHNADAIIPGYGFLSENAAFARSVKDAGLAWVGPSPEAIEQMGVKHVARDLAAKAGVPTVPGSGLVNSPQEAVAESETLGYPVMLKATGGGGGMGLITCHSADDVESGFKMVQSRGQTLFKNPGVFVEKFYPESRHVEVQVFGNAMGKAVHFGERECSIQRRHQKVIEEAPSPFVQKNPGLREKLCKAAISLAESINYGSAGTIETLVDDKTGEFFFLEMNTRLQVEHGITELCYDVDLVELMLKQADAELAGKEGLDYSYLKSLQLDEPKGAAIEARVYAENPLRDYAPSPGLLQKVEWKRLTGSRIDTWVFTGAPITPNYDPLIAKLMCHGPSRKEAAHIIQRMLSESLICGPPTNLEFLAAVIRNDDFHSGHTLTLFLNSFEFTPAVIDVISPGAYTLVQDLPARPAVGKGIPHSGPMDPIAFQIANSLVDNDRGTAGFEITLSGPELRFLGPAVVALTGAAMEATLDGEEFPMWTRCSIKAGQKLKIGKTTGGGCRSYLAIYGGLPSVAEYFGSKSTSPLVAIGGYQGRALAPGDLLNLTKDIPEHLSKPAALPKHLIPEYSNIWEIMAMVGPHSEGFFLPEDIEMIYSTDYKVSHNASRSGIRLIGPVPKWARTDGGEGGAHPSNLVEFGYPLGTLNWTGDDPCIFPVDCPNFGGFVCSTTIVRAEWWKMGQIKAGDTLRCKRVTLEEALELRRQNDSFVESIDRAVKAGDNLESIDPLNAHFEPSGDGGQAVVWERKEDKSHPLVRYRQGGDDHLIVEYGEQKFNLNHRCRVTALDKALRSESAPSWLSENLINTVGCSASLLLFYNGARLPREKLVSHLQELESSLGDLSQSKVSCRYVRLPISFTSPAQTAAIERYMSTQRPHAPYLPDNLKFVAENNAFTPEQLKQIYLTGSFMAVVIGFFCGNTVSLPIDPRHRMSAPKQNPSRVSTPEGTVSWGGSCMSIYPVESPGGYQMTGRTVPIFDYYGWKAGFSPTRPWLFEDFDVLSYYEVSESELEKLLSDFRAGRYIFDIKEGTFDMAAHNRLLGATQDEVAEIRQRQAVAQAKMNTAEEESLARWRREKEENKPDLGTVEALLNEPDISSVDAPVDANVWKVVVEEGQSVGANADVVILEAMKLEIAVRTPADLTKARVEKVLVSPGETVRAGSRIALLRSVASDGAGGKPS